jgi:Membrane protein involved in the export of O-antigen and teichoic acid
MSVVKKYSYWFHSGKYTVVWKFATLFMNVLAFMMLVRVMGPSDFGAWGLFMVISSIVEMARTALIRNAYIRFSNQSTEDEQPGLQWAAFVINLAISGVLGLLFLLSWYPVTHWMNAPELTVILEWYSLSILVSAAFAHFEMILNAKLHFKGVCWMYCSRSAVLLIFPALFFVFKYKPSPTELSLMYLLAVVAGAAIGYRYAVPFVYKRFSSGKKWYLPVFHFGKHVFGTNVCAQLFRGTDNFLTFSILGPATSSFYNACLRIGNLIDLPSQVFGDLLFPKVAKFNDSDTGSVKYMYERTVGAILVFSIPALTIILLFPSTILLLLAGKEFIVATPVLRVTAFFGFVLPFVKQFGTIMDATGNPDLNFKVMLFAFVVNLGTNLVGIHYLGVQGAAIGTCATYFILFVFIHILLKKKFGIKWTNTFVYCVQLYEELFRAAMARAGFKKKTMIN